MDYWTGLRIRDLRRSSLLLMLKEYKLLLAFHAPLGVFPLLFATVEFPLVLLLVGQAAAAWYFIDGKNTSCC